MNWDKVSIAEFLDLIGQDEMIIKNDLNGICNGDFGQVRILCLSVNEIRLVFDTTKEAKQAFNILSNNVGEPYFISSRFDYMPTVVIVRFTED